MKFSCSTMWNVRSHENGADALLEMIDMGFDEVELNYLVTPEKYKELAPVLETGKIAVGSIHNVFPHQIDPNFGTDSPLLGFEDKLLRRESIEKTKGTIDWAHRLGARAICIHASEIVPSKPYDSLLQGLYKTGKRDTEEYESLLKEFLAERVALAPPTLERTRDSMVELSDYIEKKGYHIKLGVETRSQVQQIPLLEEMVWLEQELKGTPTGIWLDIGHAQKMERLGMGAVFPVLSRWEDMLVGMHIHEVKGIDDHFSLFSIGDEGSKYIPFIAKAPCRVFEVGPKCNRQSIEESLVKVKKTCADFVVAEATANLL